MDYNAVYMDEQQVHTDLKNGRSGMAPLECRNPFTVAAITSLYSSPFAEGFNIGQHQAAIQALLRYGAHEDGMHHHTKSPDGLHPADNKVICRTDLVETSLGNVFDVITLQDHLDGGLSILVRCPGSDSTISAEKLTVNVYVTPCEVLGYEHVCGDSAMLVQAFCQEFAIPHLQCFTEWCKIESIRAPKPCVGAEPIILSRPNHLPASHSVLSIKKAQSSSTPITSLHQHSTHHCHPADAFLHLATTASLEPILLVTPPEQLALVGTVHSSHWEVVLRAMPWNLTYEQASNLSRALLADIKGTPEFHIMMPKAHPHIKVILSANACMALKLSQHDKVERFKKDLDDAWQLLDKVMKTLASKHHKSVWHIQNDLHLGHMKFCSRHSKISAWNTFCWKKRHMRNQSNENVAGSKSTLLDLVWENHMEYHELSAEDKNYLVEEFSEFRELKAIRVHITTKSRVNDITQMLKAVENEGIVDFMGSVMGIDTQDLVSKLEGFAVQGIKDGWLETVPSANLSSASSSLLQLEGLLQKWEMGTTYWKVLSDDELEQLQQSRNEQLESGEIEEHSHCTCSDKGKKRTLHSSAAASNKKYKSATTIDNEDDEESGEPSENAQAPMQPTNMQADVVAPNNTNPTEQTGTTTNAGPTAAHNSSINPATHSANIIEANPTMVDNTAVQGTLGSNFDTNNMELLVGSEQQEFLDDFADSILDFDAALAAPY
ncbi:hypothetical protein EDC04DRAFT_2605189 [Pisolithus marmoratus]|nr:hypothetical protein EDC04DRAFT_2605189 [Pisolithus marmoratus]